MEETLKLILPALGPSAGVVVVVIYFLRYIAEITNDHRRSMETLMSRVESIEKESSQAIRDVTQSFKADVAESRLEAREMAMNLLQVNREAVSTMSQMATGQSELRSEVKQLSTVVNTLSINIVKTGKQIIQKDRQVEDK